MGRILPYLIVFGICSVFLLQHISQFKSNYRNGAELSKLFTIRKSTLKSATTYTRNETSVFFEKKRPVEMKCRVATFDGYSWQCLEDDACKKKDDFILSYTNYNKRKKKIPLFLHPSEHDVHISRVLFNGGAWEKSLLHKIENVMTENPTATFIDIGAHVGVYSITLASLGYETIAIDCYRPNVERICASAMVGRKPSTLHIVHNAVSDKRGTVGVKKSSEYNVGGNFVERTDASRSADTNYLEYVDAIMLDDLLTQFEIKSAVIKMDVQGHEHEVLKGAETFFSVVNVLYVQMEFNFHRKSPSGNYIKDFMTRHRFKPVLPPLVPLSNGTRWPLDVIWTRDG